MRIKKDAYYRIIIAWLLLTTLAPIAVVKTFHHHETDWNAISLKGNVTSYHAYCDCPICHFLLFPFIVTGKSFFQLFELPSCKVVSKIISVIHFKFHLSYTLRAPPALLNIA